MQLIIFWVGWEYLLLATATRPFLPNGYGSNSPSAKRCGSPQKRGRLSHMLEPFHAIRRRVMVWCRRSHLPFLLLWHRCGRWFNFKSALSHDAKPWVRPLQSRANASQRVQGTPRIEGIATGIWFISHYGNLCQIFSHQGQFARFARETGERSRCHDSHCQ